MYEKNLTEDLRLRLSTADMAFLRDLSASRECTISECIRSIIGEYRRSIETMKLLSKTIDIAREIQLKEERCPNGDTKSNINHLV